MHQNENRFLQDTVKLDRIYIRKSVMLMVDRNPFRAMVLDKMMFYARTSRALDYNNGWITQTTKQIADDLCMYERTVQDTLRWLHGEGYLIRRDVPKSPAFHHKVDWNYIEKRHLEIKVEDCTADSSYVDNLGGTANVQGDTGDVQDDDFYPKVTREPHQVARKPCQVAREPRLYRIESKGDTTEKDKNIYSPSTPPDAFVEETSTTETNLSHEKSPSRKKAAPKEMSEVSDNDWRKQTFNLFWGHYPNKNGKKAAGKVWLKIVTDEAMARRVIAAAKLYADDFEATYWEGRVAKMAQGWLNDGRFDDFEEIDPDAMREALMTPEEKEAERRAGEEFKRRKAEEQEKLREKMIEQYQKNQKSSGTNVVSSQYIPTDADDELPF